MASFRNSAGDPARDEQVIESLARETQSEIEHVRELYEEEHARLTAGARVKTFVTVIATRLVRNVLHAEQSQN